jgi:hypothetical protein
MPERFDKLRDAMIAKGMDPKQAATAAAREYQRTRKPHELELNAAVKAEKRAAKGARIRRDGRYQS